MPYGQGEGAAHKYIERRGLLILRPCRGTSILFTQFSNLYFERWICNKNSRFAELIRRYTLQMQMDIAETNRSLQKKSQAGYLGKLPFNYLGNNNYRNAKIFTIIIQLVRMICMGKFIRYYRAFERHLQLQISCMYHGLDWRTEFLRCGKRERNFILRMEIPANAQQSIIQNTIEFLTARGQNKHRCLCKCMAIAFMQMGARPWDCVKRRIAGLPRDISIFSGSGFGFIFGIQQLFFYNFI